MDDLQFLAAHVVRAVGLAGLVLLVCLNAGGLALMIATGGSHAAAAGFIGGLFFGLLAMLISYVLAQSAVAKPLGPATLPGGFVLWVQLVPAILSAIVFFRCAFRALEALS